MAPESNLEASPVINTLQWLEHCHENGVEVNDAEEERFQLHADENGPTHHPSAPPDEIFDISTTVDPRYIISLIRKLLPADERQGDDLLGLSVWNNSTQRSDADQIVDGASSPKRNSGLNNLNGDLETMESQPVGLEQPSRSAGPDDNDTGLPKKTAREEVWEECGCVLWDLAANKEHAEYMVQNLVLEVLLANLLTSDSVRITEISLGIIGNLACHEVLMDKITSTNKLLETIVDQVFSDDPPCLCEVCRLLTLGLQGSQSVVWARALQLDHILSRVLWVAGNTLNPVLIEKSIGLFLAIMENQHVVPILLPTFMNLGLPDLLVSLLAVELGKLTSDRTSERNVFGSDNVTYLLEHLHCLKTFSSLFTPKVQGSCTDFVMYPALDSILRAVEALSVTDDYSERISSKKEVVQMAIELIKIPEKIEISSSCVTASVLLANILADSPDMAFKLSEDFLLLQSLLDLFPFTSEEFEARNALWSILARLLVRAQEAEMSSSRFSQFVLMLVDRSDMLEDALLESDWEKSPKRDNLTTSEAKFDSSTAAIKCIVKILNQWNLVKDEVSVVCTDEDSVRKSYPDDRDVQKLLDCCLKHAS
ncbi:hypothetical protein SOVF_038050 isoform B [Spinacia oleracea]|nr:hypothetical protein SOVF_038050 isoform B [Spinacia oleracea]